MRRVQRREVQCNAARRAVSCPALPCDGVPRRAELIGQRLTYTDKRITAAANAGGSLQRFAAVCCAASPG
eukprot:5031764-Alexandrium_andersonii.AAC.1